MAKHMVKCKFCGERFDANAEPWVLINSTRYAHKHCAEESIKAETEEEKDKRELEEYLKQLFNVKTIPQKIKIQLDRYIKENKYTYSGIHRTLMYFYQVKGNSIENANGGIGIVPWVYDEAYNYYYNIWAIQQQNGKLDLGEILNPNQVEIIIPPPQLKPVHKKLFRFLDDEEEIDNQ